MIYIDDNGELVEVEYQCMGMYQANRVGYDDEGDLFGNGESAEEAIVSLITKEQEYDIQFINGSYVNI